MDENELKNLFKKAAEIAKAVPEALQQAAFNRALDALMETRGAAGSKTPSTLGGKVERKSARTRLQSMQPDESTDSTAQLLHLMDRTAYPKITSSTRVLERSLYVLRAARDDFNIDGLGCSAISKILTDKFRLRASRQAVQQALDAAGDKVDRVSPPTGKTYYRIMHSGELYLDSPESANPTHTNGKQRMQRPSKKQSTGKKKEPKSAKQKASGTKAGLKSILLKLVTEGYFEEPKRIGVVREYLQHKKGYDIKITTLSPYFTRMLRDDILDRTRAEDGQYEYKRK